MANIQNKCIISVRIKFIDLNLKIEERERESVPKFAFITHVMSTEFCLVAILYEQKFLNMWLNISALCYHF